MSGRASHRARRGARATGFARGFTLVELVVALGLTAIVAGFMAMFLAAPTEAYFSQSSRAELAESAESIVRNLSADIPAALPLSVRKGQNASGTLFTLEMLATVDVARYFATGEGAGSAWKELQVGRSTQAFATIGPFNTLQAKPGAPIVLNGDYLVVNHEGTPTNDAYQQTNVITFTGTTITIDVAGMPPGEERVTLSRPFTFAGGDSPSHSVFVVSGPVAYLCDTTSQTLRRYWNYPISPNPPVSPAALAGAQSSLIAEHVASCVFSVPNGTGPVPQGSPPRVVSASIELMDSVDSRTNTLPVFLQVSEAYVP